MKNLCIIPARSGSKGLKDKNIRLLNGIPLIAYTIMSAKKTGIFDEIMVSTDSSKYANIAVEYGASVPFFRSPKTSLDNSSSWDVVKEVLENYNNMGKTFENVVLLQPTSPLRDESDIASAFELFVTNNANYVVSVCETDHSPLWCNTLPTNLSMNGFISKDVMNMPRQKLPTFYRLNGAIYIIKKDYLEKNEPKDFFSESSFAYIMDKEKSIDIDDLYDFVFAETILKFKEEKE